MKKKIALLMAMVMLFAVTTAGTLAWLKDDTDPVVNTFTVGDIEITLTETFNKDTNDDGKDDAWEAKLIPGTDLDKDPVVTVKAGSEACYVFVKVEETNWTLTDVTYTIDDTVWDELDGFNGVYWTTVDSLVDATSDLPLNVLTSEKVFVSDGLTKTEIEALDTDKDGTIEESELPKLTFTAYAVQLENVDDEVEAWTIAIANS